MLFVVTESLENELELDMDRAPKSYVLGIDIISWSF